MHEWMIDNGLTPHIVVDANHDGVDVPAEHVTDGKIVLNISDTATRDLELGNVDISFEARFGGAPRMLRIPAEAVLGIYSRETGQGMVFADEDEPGPPAPSGGEPSGKPNLKVVK
jgi:stringent starvation protein B